MDDWKLQILMVTVPTVFGAIWTAFQASAWYKQHVNGIKALAVECVEVGVTHAYETKVRDWKDAAPDRKLTTPQKTEARTIAADVAKEYAKENHSPAVLKQLTDGFINKTIEEKVTELQAKAVEAKK
jgi:hypothetical protein